MPTSKSSIRVGTGAGFSDDRIEPAADLAERGKLDYLVFECLAERTIARENLARLKDPERGYTPYLVERFQAVLPACMKNNVRIVTNMGAANPQGAARALRREAKAMGFADLPVAVVTGDDVADIVRKNPQLPLMENGEPVEYRARQVIGADGPSSLVIRAIYPDYPKQIPWFFVGQKFHDIIDCPLSADYFHFWFHPGLGHYTWSHARDGRQIVGVGFKRGDNFARKHENVVNYLADKHGVKLKPHTDDEGCAENFGPSLINNYVFGKGNVLITGQAAGFLNMIGEGMSCALHSGAISGEAIVEARLRNRPAQEIYRKMVASEVRRCTDQWNPLKIAFGRPHEADFPAALMALSWRDRTKVLRDMWRFIVLYKEFKWGRQIFRAAMQRPLLGGYSMRRWL